MTTTTMMRAVRFHSYGGADVLAVEQVSRPEPGPEQVLVRVRAASVNPVDRMFREGVLKTMMPLQFPAMAGEDFAGVVESVGSNVTDMAVGDAVFGMLRMDATGAYADDVVVDRTELARKPETLDFVQAASVPMSATTAWDAIVGAGGLKAGDRLFVHGAAGNVGGMAVQIGHALGAHVTAAAKPDVRALVMSYGADHFVSYAQPRFEDDVRDMDIVLDVLGGDMQVRSWGMLKRGGVLVSTVGIGDPGRAEALGVRAVGVQAVSSGETLGRVATMIDAGQIRTNVARVFPLEAAGEAQEMSHGGGVKGKIVLQVS